MSREVLHDLVIRTHYSNPVLPLFEVKLHAIKNLVHDRLVVEEDNRLLQTSERRIFAPGIDHPKPRRQEPNREANYDDNQQELGNREARVARSRRPLCVGSGLFDGSGLFCHAGRLLRSSDGDICIRL